LNPQVILFNLSLSSLKEVKGPVADVEEDKGYWENDSRVPVNNVDILDLRYEKQLTSPFQGLDYTSSS